ncbi:maleylpyruvate isomerase N-terminal domain-containing protein [Actinoplanes sp. NPDC051411]|uniref:maleylpyruvate isomerase N-terminal domain-containing protein n=1 Tax=Actinoplanes sp. NPDC051411 TaxID=3155522 RepID=UPI00343C36D2
MDYRRAFRSAAVSFADLIARVPAESWDDPALGDWTLRELAGHATSSGLRQVPAVLDTPAEEIGRASSEDYWLLARVVPADVLAAARKASSEDALANAEALRGDPAGVVGDLVGQATQALGRVADDDLVATPAGGMRVRDWIPTRTFELVVHGLDVARAAGVELFLGPEVYAEAAAQAARSAAMAGDGPAVLRALTGRAPLPPAFTII